MFKSHEVSKSTQGAPRELPVIAERDELSLADLEKVSGGLNPQPLPPIVRQAQ